MTAKYIYGLVFCSSPEATYVEVRVSDGCAIDSGDLGVKDAADLFQSRNDCIIVVSDCYDMRTYGDDVLAVLRRQLGDERVVLAKSPPHSFMYRRLIADYEDAPKQTCCDDRLRETLDLIAEDLHTQHAENHLLEAFAVARYHLTQESRGIKRKAD